MRAAFLLLLLLAGCSSAPAPEPALPESPVLYEWIGHDVDSEILDERGVREMLRHAGCCRRNRLEVPLVEGETTRLRNVFGVEFDVRPDPSDDGQRVMLDCVLREGKDLLFVGATTIPMGSARVWRLNGRRLVLYVPSVE